MLVLFPSSYQKNLQKINATKNYVGLHCLLDECVCLTVIYDMLHQHVSLSLYQVYVEVKWTYHDIQDHKWIGRCGYELFFYGHTRFIGLKLYKSRFNSNTTEFSF